VLKKGRLAEIGPLIIIDIRLERHIIKIMKIVILDGADAQPAGY